MITFKQKDSSEANNSNLGEQRLFSKGVELYNSILIEGLKCIEFWQSFPDSTQGDLGGEHTPHWFRIMAKNIFEAKGLASYPQWFFYPIDERRGRPNFDPDYLTSDLKSDADLRKLTPEQVIQEAQYGLLSAREGGKLKYKEMFDRNGGKFVLGKPKDYINFFKGLAAYLVGYDYTIYSDANSIRTFNVDYRKYQYRDWGELQKRIASYYVDTFGPNLKFSWGS